MSNPITWLILSYLLGAVPFGLLIARWKGVDLRSVGSGNIGATNVFRALGKAWGITTLLLDAAKGFVPAAFFPALAGEPASTGWALAFGCAAIAGHNWPVFLKFKGGKGVATSAGVLLGAAPDAVGVGLLAFILVFATTRYVSLGSVVAGLIIPAYAWTFKRDPLVLPLVLTALGLLVIYTHRANIKRLIQGTENRIQFKKNGGTT